MKNKKVNVFTFWASVLTIVIFIADIQTPRGITEEFLYMIVVMLTLWIPQKNSPVIAACLGTLLTLIGFYFSPPGASVSISLTNRSFAILGMFITMYVVMKNKEKERMMIKAHEELEKSVKDLKNSNFDLEQYAYVASHDLQEPLRNITNYADLLKAKIKDTIDEDAAWFLNVIVESANKMKNLIRDVLLLSLIGKDRVVEKVDCNDALSRTLTDMDFSIRENQASIKADKLPVIDSNETEIRQLLQNLLSNAIKFRKKNVPPEIQIHCVEKQGEWEFSVSDNGIGIEEKHLSKVFLIFQRLHSESKYSGTGIGLASCKKIVEANGGRIWVSSKPGVGSTFYFTIPPTEIQTI